jgi:peroxiredoxin
MKFFHRAAVLMLSLHTLPVAAEPIMAPDFNVIDTTGVEHSLSAYRGKTVILEWMNPYCDQNSKYYNSKKLPNLQAKWNDESVVWLMINSYPEEQEGYVSANVARYLLMSTGSKVDGFVSDKTGALSTMFKLKNVPEVVIISAQGQLVYQGAFDDHQGDGRDGLAEAPSHIDAVLTALKEGKRPMSSSPPNGCTFERK